MAGSKGVTPIVAMVLMLMIVIGLAGGFMAWMNTMRTGLENKSEEYITHEIGKIMTDFRIVSVSGNKIWIRNSGTQPLDTTKLGIFVDNQRVGFTDAGTVGAGKTGELVISSDQIPSLAKKHNIRISSVSKEKSVSEKLGYGIAFDGVDDYIAVKNYVYDSTGIQEVTITAWAKVSDTGEKIIASWDRSEYWRVGIHDVPAMHILTDNGILDFYGNTPLNDGKWHHISYIYDNGEAKIYIDGQQDAATTKGSTFGSGTTRYGFIGHGSEASSFDGNRCCGHMNGTIDEVRIYDQALSAPEVEDCYEGNCPTSGLVSSWRMNEGTGCTALDSVGGNDGALNPSCPSNSPQWVS